MSEEIVDLSIGEAAKLMGVCQNTLREWDSSGKFPSVTKTVGGHRRYPLSQIRKWLDENRPIEEEEEKIEPIQNGKTTLFEKWSSTEYLSGVNKSDDANILSSLLENAENYYKNEVEVFDFLKKGEYLWLIAEAYKRSKFKKMVSIQPMSSPAFMIWYSKQEKDSSIKTKDEPVASKFSHNDFVIFNEMKFEEVKEYYANALAEELDADILKRLPPLNLENFMDNSLTMSVPHHLGYSTIYDYIIGPKKEIELIRRNPSFDKIDFYECMPILDENTFQLKGFAGKYAQNHLSIPIWCPYILLGFYKPILNSRITKTFCRAGWLEKKKID